MHAYKGSWQLKPRFFVGGSAAPKICFLKMNIMELKIGLNFKDTYISEPLVRQRRVEEAHVRMEIACDR